MSQSVTLSSVNQKIKLTAYRVIISQATTPGNFEQIAHTNCAQEKMSDDRKKLQEIRSRSAANMREVVEKLENLKKRAREDMEEAEEVPARGIVDDEEYWINAETDSRFWLGMVKKLEKHINEL